MTLSTIADQTIAAYDSFIFGSVGRAFDANKADTLAALCILDCEAAARDRKEPQWCRDQYRAHAEFFRTQIS